MPRPDGTLLLPTDMPPSNRRVSLQNQAGIHTSGVEGEIAYPMYSVPWAPWQSKVFPDAQPSQPGVSPNFWRWKWVVAINAYSPIAHRTAPALRDKVPPRVISARGVAVPTQRPRPYAMPYSTLWPMAAPTWPSWREAPNAPGGA